LQNRSYRDKSAAAICPGRPERASEILLTHTPAFAPGFHNRQRFSVTRLTVRRLCVTPVTGLTFADDSGLVRLSADRNQEEE
jgi:hypothetical protein